MVGFFLQKREYSFFFLDAFIRVRKKVKCVTLWGLYEAFVCLVGVLLCRIHSFVCRVVHTTFQHFFVCPKNGRVCFLVKKNSPFSFFAYSFKFANWWKWVKFEAFLCIFEDFYLVELIHSFIALCVKWKKK